MNILITGGAGYIGNELVFELLKDPAVEEIIIYDNLSRKNFNLFLDTRNEPRKVRFIHGELLDSRKLRQILQGIDVVYHLAAKVSPRWLPKMPTCLSKSTTGEPPNWCMPSKKAMCRRWFI